MSNPEKMGASYFLDDEDPNYFNKKQSHMRAETPEKPHTSRQTPGKTFIEPDSSIVVVSNSGKLQVTTYDKVAPSQNRKELVRCVMDERKLELEKDSNGAEEMPKSNKFDPNPSVPFVSQPSCELPSQSDGLDRNKLLANNASDFNKQLTEQKKKSSKTNIFGKAGRLSTPKNDATSTVKKEMDNQSVSPKMEKDKVAYTYPNLGMTCSPLQSNFNLRAAAKHSDVQNPIDVCGSLQHLKVVKQNKESVIWRYVCLTAIALVCATSVLGLLIPAFGTHLIEVVKHLFYGLRKPKTVIELLRKFLIELVELLQE